ncbi:hypothetical protein Tco_1000501, partial [Tanacetum coccineum]
MAMEDTPPPTPLTILMATKPLDNQAQAQQVFPTQYAPPQQPAYPTQPASQGILGPDPALYPSQPTSLPSAFSTMTPSDPTWNMDTGASSHLNSNASNLVKDFLTRHIILRCDSSGDLYPVTKPSNIPTAFVSTSSSTWHQCLGHLDDEVL